MAAEETDESERGEGADPFALSDLCQVGKRRRRARGSGDGAREGQPHFGGKGGRGIESEIKFAFHVNRA